MADIKDIPHSVLCKTNNTVTTTDRMTGIDSIKKVNIKLRKSFINKIFRINLSVLFLLLGAFTHDVFAQQKGSNSIIGKITDTSGNTLEAVNIKINERIVATSDSYGVYKINGVDSGNYEVVFEAIGYETIRLKISVQRKQRLVRDVILKETSINLTDVKVMGRTVTNAIRQQAYNVSVINAKKLHNTSTDLGQALNTVSGIRTRESGGLGSSFNFSLDGFQGHQVKFFMDGLPIDNMGSSFQMNNIPINMAERIEVYKGVVPVWLGTDALGGAINIVSNTQKNNYLDVSYSSGSFNTHRSSVLWGYTAKSGFTAQVSAYQNYSDNDYWVDVDVANLTTGVYTPMRVRRFHDKYHNEMGIASIGVVGKKYADKLLFGITLGENQADIQTGIRMTDLYGMRKRRGNIIMPSLKYLKKDIFTPHLNLSISGTYNLGYEQIIDTSFRQYNWQGQYVRKSSDPNAVGGELKRTMYKYNNHDGNMNVNLSYSIGDKHSFALNDVYTTFDRKGKDPVNPDEETYTLPNKTSKNITGVSYRFAPDETFNITAFFKQYHQSVTDYSTVTEFGDTTTYSVNKTKWNRSGYGTALSYFFRQNLQVKASYESTFRLPENEEIFGNTTLNQLSNFALRPEHSDNYNIGLVYDCDIAASHHFRVEANGLYRNSSDLIRPTISSVTSFGMPMLQMVNQAKVRTTGVDADIKYGYEDWLAAGMNITYQNIRNYTKYEDGSTTASVVYKDRVPNMPYLFGNFNVQASLKNVFQKAALLSFGYNLAYTHLHYLNWPSLGSKRFTIPQQVQQDVNIIYSLKNGIYNISLECRNLFDNKLFDNFSLQKPSRSFSVKFRYSISHK